MRLQLTTLLFLVLPYGILQAATSADNSQNPAPTEPYSYAPLPQQLSPQPVQPLSDQDYLQQIAEKPTEVVLLVRNLNNPFWQLTRYAAEEAAKDLNMNLTVIDLHDNPLRPVRVLSSLANSSQKPDVVIFSNTKNTGRAVLELLEKHKIHSLIYDNTFAAKERMGTPGENFRFWLGEIEMQNYEASRSLTHKLIEQALERFPNHRPLPMVVLEGNTTSQANAQRLLGMFDALADFKNQIQLKQIFHTRYDPLHAYNAIHTAYQRYPEVRIIWAANDQMALSAIEACKTLGLKPGKDVLISSFDLITDARVKISQGELLDSYGGHYMSAAWALVYLKDVLTGAAPRYQSLRLPLYSGAEQLQNGHTLIPAALPGTDPRKILQSYLSDVDFSNYLLSEQPPVTISEPSANAAKKSLLPYRFEQANH